MAAPRLGPLEPWSTTMSKPFNGIINVDVRDSTPDWTPYTEPSAPEGAPNILIVLYDDTGLAAWSPYGGRINMPTMQRLADEGLTYTQWHTTALCSPTRSCLLTGRNHHQNGYACISEAATGFPGRTRTSRWRTRSWPRCCASGATTRSGSARTTTSRPTRGRWAHRRRSGPSRGASTASTASSVARRTSGIPTSSRTTTTSTSPTCPRTATTCRRTSPTRPSPSSRTASSRVPTSPGT